MFTSDGEQSDGIRATNGGKVTVRNSSFTTEGASAHGVSASNEASVNLLEGTEITVGGENTLGIEARSGASVTADSAIITTTGDGNSHGVSASGDGTLVTIQNDTTITTAGGSQTHTLNIGSGAFADVRGSGLFSSGHGINVLAGGNVVADKIKITADGTGILAIGGASGSASVEINDSGITVSGVNSGQQAGLTAENFGAEIIANGVTVTTAEAGKHGFIAHGQNGGGVIDFTGGKITTTGINSNGGYVNAGFANVKDTEIITEEERASALVARLAGIIELDNVEIKTVGSKANGLVVEGAGHISGNVTITTTGDEAHGATIGSGEISLVNSNIITSGNDAAAIVAKQLFDNEDPNVPGSVSIENSEVSAQYGASIFVDFGAGLDLTLLNTNLEFNNGQLFNVLFDGTLNASITNGHLQGAALRADSATSNALLDNTSWLVTGNSDLTSLNGINSSVIKFNAPTDDPENAGSYTTLTVGDYTSNNTTMVFNTWLGGSGSPSDRLIIDGGTVSGRTFVRINNTDTTDTGAETDPGHGIKIVRSINGGTTTDDAFALAIGGNAYDFHGQTVVGAGAYAYGLYKGPNPSNPSAGDDYQHTALDNDWYLRSQLDGEDEQFTGGVPLYEAYPQFLLGLNSLPTLQQRVGNRYWSNAGNKVIVQGADIIETYAPAEEAGVLIEANGIWGRVEGSHTKIKSRISTSGTDYDYNTFKMQAGLDGLLHETEDGKLIGGLTAHYTNGKANIYSAHGNGDIKTNGYGFGGTLTWYGENGFYLDNQAQLTWYDSDLNSDLTDHSLVRGNNGFGYALSVETGKRIALNEHWSVTPQAQLIYSNVRFDKFTDQFNGHVSRNRADSLQGRLGISADYQKSWLNDQGQVNRSVVYGIANLYNEFLNGTKVDVSGVSFTNERERLWAGIGLGGSYNWNDDKYSIYGEGSVNTSLKNFGDSYSYKGTVGFRIKW